MKKSRTTTKSKSKKIPSSKRNTKKCHSFCKTDFVRHVNHGFSDYNNERKKIMYDQCKNVYCTNDCMKNYIKNLGFTGKSEFQKNLIDNYKKRLDNNFLTDIDKRYNVHKYRKTLVDKGAYSSCLSLNKDYYNVMHK